MGSVCHEEFKRLGNPGTEYHQEDQQAPGETHVYLPGRLFRFQPVADKHVAHQSIANAGKPTEKGVTPFCGPRPGSGTSPFLSSNLYNAALVPGTPGDTPSPGATRWVGALTILLLVAMNVVYVYAGPFNPFIYFRF